MKKAIVIVLVVICASILIIVGISKFSSGTDTTTAKQTTDVKQTTAAKQTTANGKDNNQASANKTSAASNTSKKETPGGKADVAIGSVSGTPGSNVIVPISITAVPEKGIGNCNFNIKYDANILEAVEVTPGDVLGKNTAALDYSIISSTGMISFLFTSSNNGKDSITKGGVFANIKFNIKKDAKKGVTNITKGTSGAFGDVSLNKVNAVFKEGKITVN